MTEHKILTTFPLARRLLASQEETCFVELLKCVGGRMNESVGEWVDE